MTVIAMRKNPYWVHTFENVSSIVQENGKIKIINDETHEYNDKSFIVLIRDMKLEVDDNNG